MMSGTSLDGVDLAFCLFTRDQDGCWSFRIEEAETIPYSDAWRTRLQRVDSGTAQELASTDSDLGYLMGNLAREFLHYHRLQPVVIASHGQTIFHQPQRGMTLQIGKGAIIAAVTGYPVVCDFRTADVVLGGQGAPLVPIGDKLLFPSFSHCLNLGGFSNISYDQRGIRIAYDICPVNLVLNHLASLEGLLFDAAGALARSGSVIPELLESLNRLDYYQKPPPKSLGKEWVEEMVLPLLHPASNIQHPASILLRTFIEHIAIQVGRNTGTDPNQKVLVTGGGALNDFLIERIRAHTIPRVVIPDLLTVEFKEALIFAFLGLLRWRNEINILSSVTGASRDSIGGAIFI